MRRGIVLAAVGAGLLAWSAVAGDHDARTLPERVARGQYLVERVGMCQDCHSPRNAEGVFVIDQWMTGAAIGFTPTVPMPWAELAPPIAGLPTMTEDEAVLFMTSGEKPDGTRPRPPMPEYRLSLEDARAVVAYLKSLSPPD